MSTARGVNLEALTLEFQEKRARVWEDESIPPDKKQLEVDRLWREFDSQRRALQERVSRGEVGGGPVSGPMRRRMIFPRKRRRPWK